MKINLKKERDKQRWNNNDENKIQMKSIPMKMITTKSMIKMESIKPMKMHKII